MANIHQQGRDERHDPAHRTAGSGAKRRVGREEQAHGDKPEDDFESVEDCVGFQRGPLLEALLVGGQELVADDDE